MDPDSLRVPTRILFTFAIATAMVSLASISSASVAADDDGWFEIRPTSRTRPAVPPDIDMDADTNIDTNIDTGERWVVRPGDTLGHIAHLTTGSADNAALLARANRITDPDRIEIGDTVRIPAVLMRPGSATSQSAAERLANFEMQEFPAIPAQRAGRPASKSPNANPAVDTAAGPPASTLLESPDAPAPLDLFQGEVRVLGAVSVTRVAIGDGGVLRAEVLASGELLLIGEAPGSSTLHLWHTDGRQSAFNVRISERDPETRVRVEPMITMKVRIVEFRKSALGKLGIDWSTEAAGPSAAIAGDLVSNSLYRPLQDGAIQGLPQAVEPFASYLGIASSISSRIHFLASTGDAVTLAEPVLSCANGGSAEFLAGGEIPYPTSSGDGQATVEFKDYGIGLKVSPQVDYAGNVQTLIQTEISQIDPAVSVQGAPGLLTRRTQTQVNVHAGETIVLAGLISSEQSRDVNEVPGLGRLPLLGSLFRSKSLRDSATELVVFVTPEVHQPGSAPVIDASYQRLRGEGDRLIERARRRLPVLD